MIYYIVKTKKEYQTLIKRQPEIINMLINDYDEFSKKQLSEFVEPVQQVHHDFYQALYKRNDYYKIENKHILMNFLTHCSVKAFVHKYYIEVEAQNSQNIFFDILYQNSKDYVIMKKQL